MFDSWLPEATTTLAEQREGLLVLATVLVGLTFLISEVLLVHLGLRARPGAELSPAHAPANALRALAVILVPCALILASDLVIEAMATPLPYEIEESRLAHTELVRIRGEQWAWHFVHAGPDGVLDSGDDVEDSDEMHVPVGSVVRFELVSEDVLHAFRVPSLGLEHDALPGRAMRGWFEAEREGRHEIVCAEICGFGHSRMKSTLVVESRTAYRAWLDSAAAMRLAQADGMRR